MRFADGDHLYAEMARRCLAADAPDALAYTANEVRQRLQALVAAKAGQK
jgi:hypothetical protein